MDLEWQNQNTISFSVQHFYSMYTRDSFYVVKGCVCLFIFYLLLKTLEKQHYLNVKVETSLQSWQPLTSQFKPVFINLTFNVFH